jgi:hypothetical protein
MWKESPFPFPFFTQEQHCLLAQLPGQKSLPWQLDNNDLEPGFEGSVLG